MIAWLFRKLRRTPPPAVSPLDQAEAENELKRAKAELRKSERQAEEAQQVAGHLQKVNKENHFAERALLALRGIVQ